MGKLQCPRLHAPSQYRTGDNAEGVPRIHLGASDGTLTQANAQRPRHSPDGPIHAKLAPAQGPVESTAGAPRRMGLLRRLARCYASGNGHHPFLRGRCLIFGPPTRNPGVTFITLVRGELSNLALLSNSPSSVPLLPIAVGETAKPRSFCSGIVHLAVRPQPPENRCTLELFTCVAVPPSTGWSISTGGPRTCQSRCTERTRSRATGESGWNSLCKPSSRADRIYERTGRLMECRCRERPIDLLGR